MLFGSITILLSSVLFHRVIKIFFIYNFGGSSYIFAAIHHFKTYSYIFNVFLLSAKKACLAFMDAFF